MQKYFCYNRLWEEIWKDTPLDNKKEHKYSVRKGGKYVLEMEKKGV